jgi:hypothetical protein
LGGVRSLFLGDLAFFEPQMQADKRGWTQMNERDLGTYGLNFLKNPSALLSIHLYFLRQS